MKALSLSGLIIIIVGLLLFPAASFLEQTQSADASGHSASCARPDETNANSCREAEEKILKSTVRIMIESWIVLENDSGYDIDRSIGHATVKDGRYLVTHNHFSIALSILEEAEESGAYSIIYLFDTQGNLIHRAPLTDFEVFQQEDEALVFVHNEADFFTGLGFESAEFMDGEALSGLTGVEVGQIDWDGQTTRVDWTAVQETRMIGETPIIVLVDGALPGASGGGIFWNGKHVANNWRIEEQLDADGEVIQTITICALNTG